MSNQSPGPDPSHPGTVTETNLIPGTSQMHLALQFDQGRADGSSRDSQTPAQVITHVKWVYVHVAA